MIILEGADCTGKTTLAKKLIDRFAIPKHTKYGAEAHDNMHGLLQHASLCAKGTDEIADRFHLSEIPYTMYYRHELPLYDEYREIDLALRNGRNLIIVCIPPFNSVIESFRRRQEDELLDSVVQLAGIYNWYKDKAQAFSSNALWKYNRAETSFDSLCEAINEWSQSYD